LEVRIAVTLLGVLRAAILLFLGIVSSSVAAASAASTPTAIVGGVLSLPDDQLDYGRAKLAFDRIVDPSLNADAALAEIDRLAGSAGALAGPNASSAARLAALRRVIYESGDWNGRRPFAYDHADPLGQNVRNKLISTYLATRRQLRVDADPVPDRG
jgi:hypothetical protein